jgi:pSer/pThr/pTyr-binding forkhead associated (FHA) protein
MIFARNWPVSGLRKSLNSVSEIVCPSCGSESSFDDASDSPIECPFCFEEIDRPVISSLSKGHREVLGLTLIYQINQQRLEIPASGETILGRESFGAHIFSNIFFNGKQVISRRHCSIEFRGNKFYLRDEGSLNGTYYGNDKIDCKTSPQMIQNDSLIYLGEEPFLAKVRSSATEQPRKDQTPVEELSPTLTKYICNESMCGYETQNPPKVCPECRAFNSFVRTAR